MLYSKFVQVSQYKDLISLGPRPRHIPPLGPGKSSAREKILTAWRGVNLAPKEKGLTDRAQPAAKLMPKVLSSIRWDRRHSEAEVVKVWNHLIDPTIVAHAQPTGIRKGTLFVSVDSSVWLSEILVYRRKEILERLQHSFGRELITRISFRVG
jgi:predicted nucleic acid-binding Zn ribbon protein